MDDDDFIKLGIVPAYYQLAGKLTNTLAGVDQTLNEVIATDQGVPASERQQFADTELLSVKMRTKLGQVAPIAERILGPHDVTTSAFGAFSTDLLKMRNNIAHGYVVTFDLHPASVVVRTGVYLTGYVEVTILLADLSDSVERANDLLCHATCLWTHLPGSGQEPMRFEDLD